MSVDVTGYILDSSALIRVNELRVTEDVKVAMWTRLWDLVAAGRAATVDVVLEELERNEPGCFDLVRPHRGAPFVVRKRELMGPEAASVLQRVLNDFPSMSGIGQRRDKADPWLVTLAATRGWSVVTQESRTADQKIPHACRVLDVACVDLLELVLTENWGISTGP